MLHSQKILFNGNKFIFESKDVAIFMFCVLLVINSVLYFSFVLTDANETDGNERAGKP